MAKYIIDVPDDRVRDYVGSTHLLMPYTMGEHKGHHDTGLNLAPYTESDREAIEDEVWGFATICTKMDGADSVDVFGGFSLDSFANYSYQEAKAKYEAWKKQKDEIHVGDEVKYFGDNCVVVYVGADEVYHLIDENWIREVVQGEYKLTKTGRHLPEVTELLKKMRGEE